MVNLVGKGWGHEKWIVNSDKYCGKLLFFERDKRCSFHYHKLKDETFFLQSGRIVVYWSQGDDLENANVTVLETGDIFHVPPGMRHQMKALADSELFEFSTEHFDSDSYRLVRGD